MPEKSPKSISMDGQHEPAKEQAKVTPRTRNIAIGTAQPVQPLAADQAHYELHIHAAHTPGQTVSKVSAAVQAPKQSQPSAPPPKQRSGSRLSIKIWNTLEWFATSALIFLVIFFILNFSAYSELFMSKLNQLRGQNQQNPLVKNLFTSTEDTPQKLLPVLQNTNNSKTQIPGFELAIAPPDDRIIVPRINQNVPIVKVSTENLLKKDWGALEKDIQGALQDGVVHYPGTAQPGEEGNVVITGHSSYWPLDPGKFKDVFASLHQVRVGDTVLVYHNQKPYTYEVYDKKEVNPDQVEVLAGGGENRLTLITCTPVGTNLRRLIVLAKPV